MAPMSVAGQQPSQDDEKTVLYRRTSPEARFGKCSWAVTVFVERKIL